MNAFVFRRSLLGFASLLLLASPALAQAPAGAASDKAEAAGPSAPPSEAAIAEAAEHYEQGLKLYTDAEYALAVIEFERAYSLVPNYRVLYNVGQVHIQLAHYARALKALEQYLKEGGEAIPAERRKGVQRDLEMLASRTARLKVETNVAQADVLVNDIVVGQSPLVDPLLLDAGELRVGVQKAGYQSRVMQLTLAGRDERGVRIDLQAQPQDKGQRIILQKDQSDRTAWLWASWSATGAFAIGAGVLGGLGIKAANDLSDLRGDPTATRGELDSASRRARTLLTVGDVLGGLAIATGGVALYLTLSGDDKPEKQTEKHVGMVLRPGFVGVSGRY